MTHQIIIAPPRRRASTQIRHLARLASPLVLTPNAPPSRSRPLPPPSLRRVVQSPPSARKSRPDASISPSRSLAARRAYVSLSVPRRRVVRRRLLQRLARPLQVFHRVRQPRALDASAPPYRRFSRRRRRRASASLRASSSRPSFERAASSLVGVRPEARRRRAHPPSRGRRAVVARSVERVARPRSPRESRRASASRVEAASRVARGADSNPSSRVRRATTGVCFCLTRNIYVGVVPNV